MNSFLDWLASPGFAGVAALGAVIIAYFAATRNAKRETDQRNEADVIAAATDRSLRREPD